MYEFITPFPSFSFHHCGLEIWSLVKTNKSDHSPLKNVVFLPCAKPTVFQARAERNILFKASPSLLSPPPAVLYFLLQVSFLVDEGVSPVLLQLLSCALCGSKVLSAASSSGSSSTSTSASTGSGSGQPAGQSKSSTKKSKKEEKEKEREGELCSFLSDGGGETVRSDREGKGLYY